MGNVGRGSSGVVAGERVPHVQGGRVVASGVALIRRATFSSFRTTMFCTVLLFARVWGVSWFVQKKSIL